MGFDAIAHYLESGWRALVLGATFNWASITDLFNLVTLIDIILVVLVLWWLWRRVQGTALARLFPQVIGLLLLIFLAKLFGFLALFYAVSAGLVMLLIAAAVIYQLDFKKLIEGEGSAVISAQRRSAGEYDAKTFITELAEAVTLLAKAKVPSLILVKTDLSLAKLIDTGTSLNAPFNKEFVWDVFAHRSKLSAGAMIVKRGMIVSAGATLTTTAPKRFAFSPTNTAIQQAAIQYEALVIITYKDKEEVSVLHKKTSYAKLAPKNLSRILKTILLD